MWRTKCHNPCFLRVFSPLQETAQSIMPAQSGVRGLVTGIRKLALRKIRKSEQTRSEALLEGSSEVVFYLLNPEIYSWNFCKGCSLFKVMDH